jgi:hypothetical protein
MTLDITLITLNLFFAWAQLQGMPKLDNKLLGSFNMFAAGVVFMSMIIEGVK